MTRAGLFLVMALDRGISYPALTPDADQAPVERIGERPHRFYTIDVDGPFDVTDLVAVDAP